MQQGAEKRELSTTRAERVSYGLYFAGQNIFYFLIATYLQNFFTDYLGIAAAVVAIMLFVARTWDAINDPIFGVIVDRSRLKGGRFKPWIKISTFLIPVITALLFAIPHSLPMTLKIIFATLAYLLWDIAYTVCDVPIFSLTTAMTTDVQERGTLISFGRLATLLGVTLAMFAFLPIKEATEAFSGGWVVAAVVFSLVGMLFMLPISRHAKERHIDAAAPPITLRQIFSYLFKNKYLLIFYGALVLGSITNASQSMLLYFVEVNLGDTNLFMLLTAIIMLPMFLVSAIAPALMKKFDKFHIYMFGLGLSVIFSVLSFLIGYSNKVLFYTVVALRGLGMGFTNTMMFMFAADHVEYGEYKAGQRAEGVTFSVQTFSSKMISALSAAVAMLLLGIFGYASAVNGVPQPQTEAVTNGIWFLFSLFPAFSAALSFVILALCYKLRDKDVQIMSDINHGKISREEGEKLMSKEY